MKKTFLLLLPLVLALGACNKTGRYDWPPLIATDSKTITFTGDKTRTGWSAGSQITNSAFKNALEELINDQTDNALTELDGDKCAAQAVGDNDTTLTIGSSSSKGYVYFTFNLDIVRIDVTVQNYYKSYTGGFSLDTAAEVTICSYSTSGEGSVLESKNIDLSTTDSANVPAERQESLQFKEKTNTIAFFNNDAQHRTFIHSLTIYYVAE